MVPTVAELLELDAVRLGSPVGRDDHSVQERLAEAFEARPQEELARVFDLQLRNRWKLRTSSAAERITRLRRLRDSIEAHADEVNAMLHADLGRPPQSPVSLEVSVATGHPAPSAQDRSPSP
ncbi:hypothetical protein [Streptomyces sp. RB17]|uniref:hypothetical protein n=1 Tax=Streptomyces sp. RB17 TaxID=2585197 RepID=UPI001297C6CA|nr:hypothetical protein [Streptomyces sp. RB17]